MGVVRGVEEVDGGSFVCVCVCFKGGSFGSGRKTLLWPLLLLLRPSSSVIGGEKESVLMRASRAVEGKSDGVWFQPL